LAIFGVSIQKSVSFRNVQQHFSNVYYYDGPSLTDTNAAALADIVKANEVVLHGNDVTFTFARVWSAGGAPASNQMIYQGALSGVGSQADNASMDRERAVLVQWPAGVSITGQPVFLRKWYHSCGDCAGVSFSTAGVLQNTIPIANLNRTSIATAANANRAVSAGGDTYNLVSKSGRNTQGTAVCHAWLEHHQLGDEWR
jgi:hypothetical protein